MENKDLEKKILDVSAEFETSFTRSKEEAWVELSSKIDFNKGKVRSFDFTPLKWAASMALLIASVLMFLIYNGEKTHIGEEFGTSTITLPDGSNIVLNKRAQISYNDFLWNIRRKVDLEGEAYFEVEKGDKFTVSTTNGSVRVIGTKFNIRESKDNFEVYCFEGKVAVSGADSQNELYLTEGMATKLSNNNLTEPFSFNKQKLAAWTNNLFYFEKDKLEDVFQDIGEYYNLEMVANTDLGAKTFSGVFKRGSIVNVMEIVSSSMGLKYKINEGQVIIYE